MTPWVISWSWEGSNLAKTSASQQATTEGMRTLSTLRNHFPVTKTRTTYRKNQRSESKWRKEDREVKQDEQAVDQYKEEQNHQAAQMTLIHRVQVPGGGAFLQIRVPDWMMNAFGKWISRCTSIWIRRDRKAIVD